LNKSAPIEAASDSGLQPKSKLPVERVVIFVNKLPAVLVVT